MKKTLLTVFSLLSINQSANAELIQISIGGGINNAVYDNVLDVTWLADANLAANNSFGLSSVNGSMDWATANALIAAMNNTSGGTGYLGVNTWRLPQVIAVNNISFNDTFTYDGSSDRGYNLSAHISTTYNPNGQSAGFTGSELAYMYYNNFGGRPYESGIGTTSSITHGNNVAGIDDASDSANLGLFNNLQNSAYWSGTEVSPGSTTAFSFITRNGSQRNYFKNTYAHVWAVADGNLTSNSTSPTHGAPVVPEPPMALLLLAGMLSLGLRKFTKQ